MISSGERNDQLAVRWCDHCCCVHGCCNVLSTIISFGVLALTMVKKIFIPLTAQQVQNEFHARAFDGTTVTDWVKVDGKKVHIAIVEVAGKLQTYVNGQLQNETEVS